MFKLSEAKHFIGGTVSSLIAKTLTAPLDIIKLFQQVRNNNKCELMHRIQDDGYRALWRGNTIGVINQCLYSGIRFYVSHRFPLSVYGKRKLKPAEMALNGAVSGLIAQASVYPLDFIRTRMILMPHKYRSFLPTCNAIINKQGILGLWTGLTPTIVGALPYESSKYLIYNWLKQNYQTATGNVYVTPLMNSIFGTVSSMVSQSIAYPFETVRKKMMVSDKDGNPIYKTMTECFKETYKESGISGFYKGILINTIKSIPYSALEYTLYDEILLRVEDKIEKII